MASLPLLNGSSPSLAERSWRGVGGGRWGQWIHGQAEQLCATWFTCGTCAVQPQSRALTVWSELSNQSNRSTKVLNDAEREDGEWKLFSKYPAVLRENSSTLILSLYCFYSTFQLAFFFKVRQADGRILKSILRGFLLLKVSLGWEL